MSDSRVLSAANALAEALTDSPVYRGYMLAKDELLKDRTLAEKVDEYEKAHMEYQLDLSADENKTDREMMLSAQYTSLLLKEKSRNYLKAEADLYDLINHVHKILEKAYENIV